MRRQELKSTMMTINRPLEDWGKLIGDVPSATAILDRFLHRSELFQLTGRSYRLGSSENNSKGAKAPTGSGDPISEPQAPKEESSTAVNDAAAYATSSNLPQKPTKAGLARNARVFQGII
jgi:hypothetical protein